MLIRDAQVERFVNSRVEGNKYAKTSLGFNAMIMETLSRSSTMIVGVYLVTFVLT